MRELPPGLRRYLWMMYLACPALVIMAIVRLVALEPAGALTLPVLVGAAVFVFLSYVGERSTEIVDGSTDQSLVGAVYIAVILLFPAPLPVLIAFLAALVSRILHDSAPLYKRLFNVCQPTLVVALSSLLISRVAAPTTLLRPGHVVPSLPALALLPVLFYVADTGLFIVLLSLLKGQSPWRVWWETDRHTCLPQLAVSTLGILVASVWLFDHVLLALFALPLVALRVAFRAIQAEERATASRRRSDQLETVLAAGQRLQLQRTQEELLRPVAEAARALTGAAVVAAYRRDGDDALLRRVVLTPDETPSDATDAYLPAPPPGQGVRQVEDKTLGMTLLAPLEPDEAGVTGLLQLLGVPGELGHDSQDALAILATQAAIALQNAHLHERALAQASEDGLTGLLNHRAFQTRLEEEIARARRGRPLALMMVDLDDFGGINNTYGHQAGDATLAAIAAALRASVRGTDIPARYGGDEFAVILPETGMDEALEVAARTYEAIAALRVATGGAVVRIGTSIGVAATPLHATAREALVHAADRAVYAAKHGGKGRVGRPEEAALSLDRDPDTLAAQLEHANMATVEALAAAVDAKDPYTRGHSGRVSAYATAIVGALGLPEADVARVRLAGLLHDVGKIGVPDAILTKTGKLDDAEFMALQQHPVIGERMLAAAPFLREILPAVRHHHERWDGKGYPDGLAAGAIPEDAAILMVADSFDAMTSSRTYRPALSVAQACQHLREGGGSQFDARIVAAFEQAFESGAIPSIPSVPSVEILPAHEDVA